MVDVHTESYVSVWLGIALFAFAFCKTARLRKSAQPIAEPYTF